MPPAHRARSPSTDRHAGHGSRTDARSADPAAAPPAPATPVRQSPSAYRSGRSPATPARRAQSGSSPLQNADDPRQGGGAHILIDNDPPGIAQHDLDPPARPARRSARKDRPRFPRHLRRPIRRRALRHNNRRDKPDLASPALPTPELTPPGKQQVGIQIVPARYQRHRRARRGTLRHNPRLVLIRPAPAIAPALPQARSRHSIVSTQN